MLGRIQWDRIEEAGGILSMCGEPHNSLEKAVKRLCHTFDSMCKTHTATLKDEDHRL